MIIEGQKLKKSFFQGKKEISVLKEINLQVSNGETIAILGKSGSGKSTLLSILAGLDHPTSGSLKILGQDFVAMNENEKTKFRGRHIGFVFQSFHLIPHLTALENISLPLDILNISDAESKALEFLARVGLANRGNHLPKELSGGEMQRVAVARALISSPGIILADEPSGSLDEENAFEVTNLLFELIREENKAMILVTHDNDLAERCSKRLGLDHGVLSDVH
mgnify:CR=1 FL=1